jgi:hypothetical protein
MNKIAKDIKLNVAKDLTNAFVSSYNKDNENKMSVEDVCEAFKKFYTTVEEVAPEQGDRKIGLGL